jgi:ABC-type multidrug transport system ATPase subunit
MSLKLHEASVRVHGAQLLRDASFEVTPGKLVGLLGPTGAGKTVVFSEIVKRAALKGTKTIVLTDLECNFWINDILIYLSIPNG